MTDYIYKVTDIGEHPRLPTAMHRLVERVISRRRVDVYEDKRGHYWRADSPSIQVERVEQ